MPNRLKELTLRKIILMSILVLFCFILMSGVSLFFGPPFGKVIAKNKVSDYIVTMYSSSSSIDKIVYNFKNRCYHVSLNDHTIEIRYDPFKNTLYDTMYQEKILTELKAEMKDIARTFPETIELPAGHMFTGIIANGKYNAATNKIRVRQKLYLLGITNWDYETTMEESMKNPAKITESIIEQLGDKYNITGVQIVYRDINGVFEIIDELSKEFTSDLEGKTVRRDRISLEDEQIMESIRFNGEG